MVIDKCAALDDIVAERRRQIEREGWDAEHDDNHSTGEIALAAASYAYAATISDLEASRKSGIITAIWPWHLHWFKPQGKRRNLVKAGALIVAEIERLDRASAANAA